VHWVAYIGKLGVTHQLYLSSHLLAVKENLVVLVPRLLVYAKLWPQQRGGNVRKEVWAQLTMTAVELDGIASFSRVHIQM